MRRILVYILRGLIALAVVAAVLILDAFWFEPNFPILRRVTVRDPDLPSAFDGYRIAFITDIHVINYGSREERMLRLVRRFRPDLILLGGDFVEDRRGDRWQKSRSELVDEACRVFSRLSEPDGIFAVTGNWDWPGDLPRYRERGVRFLKNESVSLSRKGETIYLAGTSVSPVDFRKAFAGIPANAFIIFLNHFPDRMDQGLAFGADLCLSGHSHGGQCRFPFVRTYLPGGCNKYVYGKYKSDGAVFYVSPGVGNHIRDVRFRCRSEVTGIILKKGKNGGKRR